MRDDLYWTKLLTVFFLISQAGEKFVADTMSRINTTVNPGEAVSDSDLVIEAIVENIDVKHKLFAELDNKASRYMKMIMRNTCTPPSLV